MRSVRHMLQRAAALSVLTIVAATMAHAGPPLVCWKVETGNAASLPWIDRPKTYEGMDSSYPLSHLASDTLALLAPTTPVLERMETLRRAALYASGDRAEGEKLLSALVKRTESNPGEPLAWFDAGYLVETRSQALGRNAPGLWNRLVESLGLRAATAGDAGKRSGYECILEAIRLAGGNPEMEYAAALVTWHPRRPEHEGHLARAAAGATAGSLLEKNLLDHFGDRGRSLEALRVSTALAAR